MARPRIYSTNYQRVVERTAEPSNSNSCWIYEGLKNKGYGYMSIRVRGVKHPKQARTHRIVLEHVLQMKFPFDEGGHLCGNPACVNPDHLEVQTSAMNLAERKGYAPKDGKRSWIPVLFPIVDPLQDAANDAWDSMFNRS